VSVLSRADFIRVRLLGIESLGQLLHGILFEPGHPVTTLDVELDSGAAAAKALNVRGQ